jgi:hypothetical protein
METMKLITPEVEKYLKTQKAYDVSIEKYQSKLKELADKYPD